MCSIIEEERRLLKLDRKHDLRPGFQGPSVDELLKQYLFDPNLVPTDCQQVMKLRHKPGYDIDEDRIFAIRSHPRFLAWLELNESSSILLVNANSALSTSPEMSFVSAELYQHVVELTSQKAKPSTELIPLAFFCSQHWDFDKDENGTPSELAMSLLLQLLDTYRDFDPEVLNNVGVPGPRRC
jgi:hypothetical protein